MERYKNMNKEFNTFKSGAQRTKDTEHVRYDLICPEALKRLATVYAEGAAKYGDLNWCKGLPIADTVNHAINHLQLWIAGDRSEDNLAKAVWGLFSIMHFESNCGHHKHATQMKAADDNYLEANRIEDFPDTPKMGTPVTEFKLEDSRIYATGAIRVRHPKAVKVVCSSEDDIYTNED